MLWDGRVGDGDEAEDREMWVERRVLGAGGFGFVAMAF